MYKSLISLVNFTPKYSTFFKLFYTAERKNILPDSFYENNIILILKCNKYCKERKTTNPSHPKIPTKVLAVESNLYLKNHLQECRDGTILKSINIVYYVNISKKNMIVFFSISTKKKVFNKMQYPIIKKKLKKLEMAIPIVSVYDNSKTRSYLMKDIEYIPV